MYLASLSGESLLRGGCKTGLCARFQPSEFEVTTPTPNKDIDEFFAIPFLAIAITPTKISSTRT